MVLSRCMVRGFAWVGPISAAILMLGMTPGLGLSQTIPDVASWTVDSLRSEVLGETRIIRVALPRDYERYGRATERFPVLIQLDMLEDDLLMALVANARVLASYESPAIPPIIVVGVETQRNFRRDMTPPPRDGPSTDERIGGAPNFARFIETELLPFLAARYRTLPFTIVAGHSLSGLFAAYVYGQSPGFVNAAIAISPTLIWDEAMVQQVADAVRARTTSGRLFVAAGIPETSLDGAAMRLAANLNENPGASTTFEHHRLADDSHYTSLLQGMIDGLRFVFRPIQLANTGRIDMAEKPGTTGEMLANYRALRARYGDGARELGLPEHLPPMYAAALGSWFAQSDRVPAAMEICQDVIATSPEVWVGYWCLGNAQRTLGDSTSAAATYRKGIVVVERTGDTAGLSRLQRALQRVLAPPGLH